MPTVDSRCGRDAAQGVLAKPLGSGKLCPLNDDVVRRTDRSYFERGVEPLEHMRIVLLHEHGE